MSWLDKVFGRKPSMAQMYTDAYLKAREPGSIRQAYVDELNKRAKTSKYADDALRYGEPVKFHGMYYGKRIEGDDIPEELLNDPGFLAAGYALGKSASFDTIHKPARVTCRYCGQWGERETQCGSCGAAMP